MIVGVVIAIAVLLLVGLMAVGGSVYVFQTRAMQRALEAEEQARMEAERARAEAELARYEALRAREVLQQQQEETSP
jgi:hypothetical protein